MILALDSAAGTIRLGDPPERLPGILESVEIDGALAMENAPLEGRSGTTRTVHGWNDSNLRLALAVIDDPSGAGTRWDCLAMIVARFKAMSADGGPEVYRVEHPMLAAWGVRSLLFSELRSDEARGRAVVNVTLTFVEHEIVMAAAQQRRAAAGGADTAASRQYILPPVVEGPQPGVLSALEARVG